MFKKFSKVAVAVGTLLALSACASTTELTFKNPETGKVVAKAWEHKDATVPMAPSTATQYFWDGKTITATAMVAGATPVEQVMPAVSAYGAYRAAGNIKPSTTNVNNSNSNVAQGGEGGDAYSVALAEGGDAYSSSTAVNWTNVQQNVSVEQWTKITNCQAGVRDREGRVVMIPACGGY